MFRPRITSSGFLPIATLVVAAAVFFLDLCYLQPLASQQESFALRERQGRVEQTINLVLESEMDSLRHLVKVWCETNGAMPPDAAASNRPEGPKGCPPPDASPAAPAWAGSRIDVVLRTDAAGSLLEALTPHPGAAVPTPRKEAAQIESTLGKCAGSSGLLRLPAGLVVFASGVVKGPAGHEERLWFCRRVDEGLFRRVGACVGGQVQFVAGEGLPSSVPPTDEAHCAWKDGSTLCMAWLVSDAAGAAAGFFRVEMPVTLVTSQASAARWTMLAIVSLAAGVPLLMIVGVHVLITRPVARLLGRLQGMEAGAEPESGEGPHGPLVLMRRLEWAFDRLTRLSKTDSLTGLANRRHFEQVLEAFYHQARRYHRPLSVIAVDVDFFKAVNDTGGHSAGDQVLKQLAAAIVLAGRKADIPARLGGDEFAVLLPETSAADAQAVAERIAAAVRDLKGPVSLPGQGITISAGVADLDSAPIDSPEALLALSDRALYAAKEAGRNRIVQAHDLTGALPAGTAACGRQADRDSQKVVALDGQFKQLFLRAVEEIVAAFEQRSPRLAGHARQVQHDALLIGGKMNLSPRVLERLRVAATLHDIGKIGMADRVLGAPADLGPETLADLRQHPVLSARIMEGMRFLEDEVPAVRHHHERYDGSGYPDGLAGEAIPIEARILAVADAFALITSGEGGAGVSEAFAEIRTGSGTHFDPAVVEALAATLEPAAAVTGSLAGAGLKPER